MIFSKDILTQDRLISEPLLGVYPLRGFYGSPKRSYTDRINTSWPVNKRKPLKIIPDWRIAYIRQIINSFSKVLNEVYQMPIENIETEKRLEKERVIENIIGMAFLTSQIYISGTIADVKFFSRKPDKINKELFLKKFGDPLPGRNVTRSHLKNMI